MVICRFAYWDGGNNSGGGGGGGGGSVCQGSLEVRTFAVPGWNDTLGAGRRWPGHSRVNHNKYIVTDSVANIATSNFAWSYFRTTVGTSLNVESAALAGGLMRVFDRDWDSKYAAPLPPAPAAAAWS